MVLMLSRIAAAGYAKVVSLSRRNVKRTSFPPTGAPSCHLALGLIWNATYDESGAHRQRSASRGLNPASPTVLSAAPTSARLSKIWSPTCLPMIVIVSGGKIPAASAADDSAMVPPTRAPPDNHLR